MYARAVDQAALRIRELEHVMREDLALAAIALTLAIAATRYWPALALPLFLAGVGLGTLGMRALWRHWDLLDRLVDDRDAYVIPQVRKSALREASRGRRHYLAAQLRAVVLQPRLGAELRALGMADELDALADQLADDELVLDPMAAVVCKRLVCDPESPLFDSPVRSAELRARIHGLRSEFRPR
jgi:hypothetical protein